MAQEIYGAEIENLGRSFAVSPTLAAVWRGDVDADRALLHAVTDVRYKGTEVNMPGATRLGHRWSFLQHVRRDPGRPRPADPDGSPGGGATTHAPEAYNEWMAGQSDEELKDLSRLACKETAGLKLPAHCPGPCTASTIDWNELSQVVGGTGCWDGQEPAAELAYYADPANKTVFTREQMLGKFEQTAKSKMLMGRGYNRYLRGLTSMAGNEEELQAAVTLASNIYQKALDNQKMTSGELALST